MLRCLIVTNIDTLILTMYNVSYNPPAVHLYFDSSDKSTSSNTITFFFMLEGMFVHACARMCTVTEVYTSCCVL